MKKAILLVFVLLSFGVFSSSVFAQDYTVSNNFKSAWSKKVTVDQTGYFKYGYNTALINEDFVHAWHPGHKINAKLKNGTGTHYASWSVVYMRYAAEVTHSGSTVTYTYTY